MTYFNTSRFLTSTSRPPAQTVLDAGCVDGVTALQSGRAQYNRNRNVGTP